jgi:mannose-6-phosphate isomerase-like protein (cupin superfamily)
VDRRVVVKYFQSPDHPRRSASLSSNETMPEAHQAQLSSVLLVGPDAIYARHDLGNFSSERLAIAIDTYDVGGHTDTHAHSEMEQAYYVISGRALIRIGDEELEVGPGGSGYIPLHTKHGFRNVGDTPLTVAVISSVLGENLGSRESLKGI